MKQHYIVCGYGEIGERLSNDPDTVYVGTKPPALYRTRDGGESWQTELTTDADDSLLGRGFYELAVDPDRQHHALHFSGKHFALGRHNRQLDRHRLT